MTIRCRVCPRMCNLEEGQAGFCRTRMVKEGRIENIQLGTYSAACFDPTHKKNLYHFHPQKTLLSLGGFGCNLACTYCQNYAISQRDYDPQKTKTMNADEIIALARSREDCVGVAFGYNEPAINFEAVSEVGTKLAETDLKLVLGTNGFVTVEYRQLLFAYAHAVVVSFRGFSKETCQEVAKHPKAHTQALGAVIQALERKIHTEVTYILIPNVTDGPEMDKFFSVIAGIDPLLPVHILGYVPYNQGKGVQATIEEITEARERALATGLTYVYGINCQQDEILHSTFCPVCSRAVIKRDDVDVLETNLRDGGCGFCGAPLAPLVV